MRFFNSDYFTYENNELYCEALPVSKIAQECGTPVYIYSKKFFTDKYNAFSNAFKDVPHKIFFATKSNFNINVMKVFYDLGAGIDVNSEGELYRALKAGAKPEDLILTGVGKTDDEIKLGLEKGVCMIKAESIEEVHLINDIAEQMNMVAPLAIRVNPDVDAETHPYITTALSENKFGVGSDEAIKLFVEASKLKNVNPTGIDMHIGSQITKVSPFVEATGRMADMYFALKKEGIHLEHFDIGGGMGILYNDETPFTIEEFAEALLPIFKKLDCEIFFEPGRSLTANGGILATRVLYTKKNHDKNFIVVDGAMTDILRPSIYGAYHHIQPVVKYNREDITADVVGPVCESGDFLAKKRSITQAERGELLAVMSAGAYGMTMASNYNARRRAPEVIVDGNEYYVTRGRETFEFLLHDEKIVDDLHK